MLFDCLALAGKSLIGAPLAERREALEAFHAEADAEDLLLSPYTCDRAIAESWLALAGGAIRRPGRSLRRLTFYHNIGPVGVAAAEPMVSYPTLRLVPAFAPPR